jgi:broad specificity phosphatase PhoE
MRIQGCRSDTSLNERGKEQAEKVALALREEKVDAIYSSPLKRAVNTAQPLAQIFSLEVNIEPDLREIDAGELEGLPVGELEKRYKGSWKQWIKDSPTIPLPGGESVEELQRRAWGVIRRINGSHPEGVVVVFSHLFAILTIVCHILELDLVNMWRLRQNEAGITVLEVAQRGNFLLSFNDTCHLEAE